MPTLYTLGHSNHSLETFLGLLQHHQITAVADVRSHPYSRYLPHFNQKDLQMALKAVQIQYVFLGKELGARPQDLSCYHQGKALYERIAQTPLFQQGMERLHKGLEQYKISLICAEKDPLTCHRTILVCRQFQQRYPQVQIQHILSDGSLESQEQLEQRLLKIQGFADLSTVENQPKQLSLFDFVSVTPLPSREDCLAQVYQKQGDQIAYVDPNFNAASPSK